MLGGNYLYNGTAAQKYRLWLTRSLTGDLIINNPGTVTLSAARTIKRGNINLTSGAYLLQVRTVTYDVLLGLIIRSGGECVTRNNRRRPDYDVTYNGASKLAGTELQGGFIPATRIRNLTMNTSSRRRSCNF